MQRRPSRERRPWTLAVVVVGLAIILGGLAVAWFAAPDLQPLILLAAFAADALGAVGLFVIQRRRHW